MPGYNGKVFRAQGGDELVVAPGGKITADGVQPAHLAALKVNYTTGDLDAEAEIISALNATNTRINAIMTALEGVGIFAAS